MITVGKSKHFVENETKKFNTQTRLSQKQFWTNTKTDPRTALTSNKTRTTASMDKIVDIYSFLSK